MSNIASTPETTPSLELPLLERPFCTPKDAKIPNIESFLVVLTSAMMENLSTSTYNIIRAHCHPELKLVDYTLHECGLPQASSLQQHLNNVEALKSVHPDWQVNPFNFSVTLCGPESDRAVVWFTSRGMDQPGDWLTNRESVHRVHWRRRHEDGIWEVHMHSGLRGPGNLFLQSHGERSEGVNVPVTSVPSMKLYSERELKN